MQTLYNELAEYFDSIVATSSVDTEKETNFLDALFKKHHVRVVLDVACGTGRHSVALAEAGYETLGIDYAAKLLEVARSKTDLANIEFLQQDVAAIKLLHSTPNRTSCSVIPLRYILTDDSIRQRKGQEQCALTYSISIKSVTVPMRLHLKESLQQ